MKISAGTRLLDVFHDIFALFCGLCIGGVMVAVPLRDFIKYQATSKALSPAQESDYSKLLAQPSDEGVTAAANGLFKRDDIAQVLVWRGSWENPTFQVRLKKDREPAAMAFAPQREIPEGYMVQVAYAVKPEPFDLWGMLGIMKDGGAFICGLVIIGFALLEWRPHRGQKKEEDQDETPPRRFPGRGLRSVK